jgi:hypothetical protein
VSIVSKLDVPHPVQTSFNKLKINKIKILSTLPGMP